MWFLKNFTLKSNKNDKKRHRVHKKGLEKKNKKNICVDKVGKGDIMKSLKQMFVICSEVY